MSSGQFFTPHSPEFFDWDTRCDPADYFFARYHVSSLLPPLETALGMAMEQSAATLRIEGYVEPDSLAPWTIRVRSVNNLTTAPTQSVLPYQLETDVYGSTTKHVCAYQIELAIPRQLLAGKTSQLMNIFVGELPRLGFLTSFSLVSAPLCRGLGPGPAFGTPGLRKRLDVMHGPMLCRSMRPAVGVNLETMARLNHDVLCGGFHLVKDDELQVFVDARAYERHVAAMVKARNIAEISTGEKKSYLANLICEPDEMEERWDICVRHGVDGVLVAPFIQGMGILSQLARRRTLPILAHNTSGDLLYRNQGWGIDESVITDWMRHLGADWWVTPGPSGATIAGEVGLHAVLGAGTNCDAKNPPMMPILQGGKSPSGLADYRRLVGNDDFMLIVASWVDRHKDGLQKAAQIFRQALGQ